MLRYLEIRNQLLAMTDRMQPGEKLMDRCSLCRILDTTRTTLDKAIRDLTEQGILVSRKGSGTYLAGSLINPEKNMKNWCVIVPNFENVYAELVSGIESAAREYDVNVILCCSENSLAAQERFIHRLLASGVDGFIIVPVITGSPGEAQTLYNQLQNTTVPFVFCNREVEGINVPVITSNDFYGGYIAVRHLISRGYRRIAFAAHRKYRTSMNRCQGYMAALQENGIEIDRRLIVMPPTAEAVSCREAAAALIAEGRADAFFCFNQSVSEEVLEALRDSGKCLSDDIGVIGYGNGDAPGGQELLTTVSYRSREIGKKAAEVLYKYNLPETPAAVSGFDYYLFQPEICDRKSCLGKKLPCSGTEQG